MVQMIYVPATFFKRLPLSMISFHCLQITRARQITLMSSSLMIFSTISGGKFLMLTDSFIFFASAILKKFLYKRKLFSLLYKLCAVPLDTLVKLIRLKSSSYVISIWKELDNDFNYLELNFSLMLYDSSNF